MAGEQIYLAARACAHGDQMRDLADPIDWRRKPSLIAHLRADLTDRMAAKAAKAAGGARSAS